MGVWEPIGGEIPVNSYTMGDQGNPDFGALADGGFVGVWVSVDQDGSAGGVYAQRYDATGASVGPEFRVNSHTEAYQSWPSVAGLSDGGFLVAWNSLGQDGSGFGVYAQRFGADGLALGPEFRVNTYATNHQYYPDAAALADGGFVVCWTSSAQDGSTAGIYGQRFGADGASVGPEFRANTHITHSQEFPTLTALAPGGFVIAWVSNGQDGGNGGIYAQRYDAAGAPTGLEFRVNTRTSGDQNEPAIQGLADGGFLVSWTSHGQDGDLAGIFAQRFTAAGAPTGPEFRVNTHRAEDQTKSVIAALEDGGFVVSWQSWRQDGSLSGIYAQRYSARGEADGAEFRVNSYTQLNQLDAAITGLAGGGFVVGWTSAGPDGSGTGVSAQIYAPVDLTPAITSGGGVDVCDIDLTEGSITAMVVRAVDPMGGDIVYAIAGGADAGRFVIDAGSGALAFAAAPDFEAAADVNADNVYEVTITATSASGVDGQTIRVTVTDVDESVVLIGADGRDVLEGTAFGDTLSGADGDDSLLGGAGDDTLDGGAGSDRMTGGTGDDRYVVDSAGDRVIEAVGQGIDTVASAVSHRLAIHFEVLELTGTGAFNGFGNGGDNRIVGNGAANVLKGLEGADTIVGGDGQDRIDGGIGADMLSGGTGDDRYYVDDAADTIIEADGEGVDIVYASADWTLGEGLENLALFGNAAVGTGNGQDNSIAGAGRSDTLRGLDGNDVLRGNNGVDVLDGGAGNDLLWGGALRDVLTGSGGADDFRFAAGDLLNLAAQADRITDFNSADGDQIYLNLIDADAASAGDQAFTLIGTAAFTGNAGQLRTYASAGDTVITGDTDGDGIGDIYLRVAGTVTFAAGDLVL